MITYDVRGERAEGVPTSTEVCNVRTLGGAKAVAQRLKREGFTEVTIVPKDTKAVAETVNPFGRAL